MTSENTEGRAGDAAPVGIGTSGDQTNSLLTIALQAFALREFESASLDAMDPNDLRVCVETAIKALIEPVAWERCNLINQAEQESLKSILEKWGAP